MPDALAEMVERLVAEGKYASHSDVIRDGLRALEARKEEHAARFAAIREGLQERLQGEFLSMEEGQRRFDVLMEERKRGRKTSP
ncbi:type II toxin-antitoxin system ParD family antitoxin [Hyphomonas sp.]|uniref:ribbon-helix-helix domain-containing protein n=1 Tax=Hyphomonas sp. TaxID=87 RepID=UPI0025B8E2DE|nr:type II toxin-antitoxin system ParD family antitoxin [Hyphomonas sp.]